MCVICEVVRRRTERVDAFEDKEDFAFGAVIASTNDPEHFEKQLRLFTTGFGLEGDEGLRLWSFADEATELCMLALVTNPHVVKDILHGTIFEAMLQGLTLAQVIRERETDGA